MYLTTNQWPTVLVELEASYASPYQNVLCPSTSLENKRSRHLLLAERWRTRVTTQRIYPRPCLSATADDFLVATAPTLIANRRTASATAALAETTVSGDCGATQWPKSTSPAPVADSGRFFRLPATPSGWPAFFTQFTDGPTSDYCLVSNDVHLDQTLPWRKSYSHSLEPWLKRGLQ